MELLVMGIGVMALGAILVHLAIQGAKAEQVPVEALVPEPLLPSQTRAESAAQPGAASLIEFSKSDVLLADTLTELLDVKQQVTSLQAKLDALSVEMRAPVSSARPVRRRTARGAA
ncbi:MAG TPA: hypothetical protein VJB57_08005 [Dehalococcoidia bacterium]|nr:hypothetical protein [Dehalococcoidia bacterium]